MLFSSPTATRRRRLRRLLPQGLLRRRGPLLHPPLLRRRPSPRRRRHRRPHPLQGIQGLREAREAVDQEAGGFAEEVRARLGPGARHQRHHREDQAAVRQLRQVRPPLRLRRPATPHRQRRPAALGRVHHPRLPLPLHRRMDRLGRPELPHRHQGRQEAHHEGDHHRRAARLQAALAWLHLARGRLQGARQRRSHRQGRVMFLTKIDAQGKASCSNSVHNRRKLCPVLCI